MSLLSNLPCPGELDQEEQARLEHEATSCPERPMDADEPFTCCMWGEPGCTCWLPDDAAAWWQGEEE